MAMHMPLGLASEVKQGGREVHTTALQNNSAMCESFCLSYSKLSTLPGPLTDRDQPGLGRYFILVGRVALWQSQGWAGGKEAGQIWCPTPPPYNSSPHSHCTRHVSGFWWEWSYNCKVIVEGLSCVASCCLATTIGGRGEGGMTSSAI